MADRPLYPVCRTHLGVLSGPLGIWQHSIGPVPDPSHGTCTDDVSRALLVDLAHAEVLGWPRVRTSAWRALEFLAGAWQPDERRFRNFRAADATWADAPPSEDSQGRAMLALGTAAATDLDPAVRARAAELFAKALPGVLRLGALRAISSVALGCTAALGNPRPGGPPRVETEAILATLAARLLKAFSPSAEDDPRWPWPEPILTYENSLPARALIVAGQQLGDARLLRAGLRVLDWLIEVQLAPSGVFSPVGNRSWWRRGAGRSRFDQQPIEGATMILACEAAWSATADARYLAAAERAYGWFLGDNDTRVPVADPVQGACHDGLEPDGVNANQGAESTLAWLMALERIRALRRAGETAAAARVPEPERGLPAPVAAAMAGRR